VASVESLRSRVRMELNDSPRSFVWGAEATGTHRYEMPYSPVDGASLAVFVNGTDVSNSVEVEEHTGVLTFDDAPDAGDEISVSGTYFRYFSDTELDTFVHDAVAQHSHNRTDEFGRAINIGNLPVIEDYPVSILGTIQALYALVTDASFDIDISTPDGVGIPRSERYRQLMEMIQARRDQYNQLCQALNIGINRIEVFTFRRISKRTNRYVPVYLPQELDDRSKPVRAYLPLPTYGTAPGPDPSGRYDIVLTQGDSFSVVLDFPFDITGYTALAQIRLYPESAAYAAQFEVTEEDYSQGKLRISLSPEQTKRLTLRSYWDIQLTANNDPEDVKTYISGTVFCKRQISKDQPMTGNFSPTGWEQYSISWGGMP
jgi:hypothetical protein